MTDYVPKKVLFGELNITRLCHGMKRMGRDVARSDIVAIGASDRWYELYQDRKEWFELCKEEIEARPRRKNACSADNQPQSKKFYSATSGGRFH